MDARADHVSLAAEPEAAQIAALFRAARQQALPYLPVLHTPAEDLAFFRGQLRRPGGRVWTSRVRGELAGFLVWTPGWVDHLYVAPEWQGQGHGSLLLRHVQARSRALQLWTFQRNAGARAFYRRHGFAEVELTEGHGNEEREPDVRMTWSADGAADDV